MNEEAQFGLLRLKISGRSLPSGLARVRAAFLISRLPLTTGGVEGVGVVERAFQLAPECASLDEVRQRLRREGYLLVQAHLEGKQIRDQLYERLDPTRKKPKGRGWHDRISR